MARLGVERRAYGALIDVIEHTLCEGGPTRAFVHIRWLTIKRTLFRGRMPVVQYMKDDSWNTG
jgi:hypothetical protein